MELPCECGCGQAPRPGKRFVHGHWSRTLEAKALFAQRRVVEYQGNPSGLCLCGCGEPTGIAAENKPPFYRQGEPRLYRKGHHMRGKRAEQTSQWHGGRARHSAGYVYIYAPDHPDATQDGYVLEHRLVAEQMLGRRIQKGEHVHHINGVKTDNRAENLIVLKHADHARLHPRQALDKYFQAHDRRTAASAAGKKGAASRWGKKT